MRRWLLDTNVVFDILLKRQPHLAASKQIWMAAEERRIEGMISAHAITTVHYVVRKDLGAAVAHHAVTTLLRIFSVAAVDQAVIADAVALNISDFEDAVTASAAKHAGCGLIVTRDPSGFRSAPVRSLAPAAVLPLL